MQLTLFKTESDSKVINKVLTSATNITINLHKNTDINAPRLKLSKIPNLEQFNYAHIDGINRYYFIDSIENLGNELFVLNLECDYLETYKADILGSLARFKRALKHGDFADVSYDTSVIKDVKLFEGNKTFNDGTTSFIVTVVGV